MDSIPFPPHSPMEGFSKFSYENRKRWLRETLNLTDEDLKRLDPSVCSLKIEQAEHLIENVIGTYSLPLGLASYFYIDGRDVAIPMVVEETSIVAAASAAAKWVRRNGGFRTRALGRLIIGQIQFPFVEDAEVFCSLIQRSKDYLIQLANKTIPNLVQRGGGVQDLQVRLIERPDLKSMAVLHLYCDPCDAMGANLINQVCEALKEPLESITKQKVGLCILSNLVDTKLIEAQCELSDVSPELGERIQEATLFANLDPYRCATHNKGVMNGIDPILIATGNDWRAVEAGIHAYVALNGSYRSITQWEYRGGVLHGRFCAPIAVGTVGGVTRVHPTAQTCLKILGVQHAVDLARICAAVGLGQNLAALKALCGEGIVKGHMRLHVSNLALAAGASSDEVQLIEEKFKNETKINFSRVQEILSEIRAHATAVI